MVSEGRGDSVQSVSDAYHTHYSESGADMQGSESMSLAGRCAPLRGQQGMQRDLRRWQHYCCVRRSPADRRKELATRSRFGTDKAFVVVAAVPPLEVSACACIE